MARLRQLGASFSFTRAGIAAIPLADGSAAAVDASGIGFDANNDGSGGGGGRSNRGPGGGRRFEGPAKPGAQRILDAMCMGTLWDNKVSWCVDVTDGCVDGGCRWYHHHCSPSHPPTPSAAISDAPRAPDVAGNGLGVIPCLMARTQPAISSLNLNSALASALRS